MQYGFGIPTGTYSSGGGFTPSGAGGFDWGSLLSNPMVIQMMAKMGASLDPEGPAGAIGGMTNQWIQNKQYMDMMKKLLGGGAKVTFDKDTWNMKGQTSALAGAFGSGGQEKEGLFGSELKRDYASSFKF